MNSRLLFLMVVFQVRNTLNFSLFNQGSLFMAVTDLPDLPLETTSTDIFLFVCWLIRAFSLINNRHKNDEDELWTNQLRLCFGRDFLREGAELWRSVRVLRGVDRKECGDGTVCLGG